MRHRVRGAVIGSVLCAMVPLLTGCSNDSPAPTHIALFGDSLADEAQPYYVELVHDAGDVAYTYDTYGGTAICDWLTKMREVEAADHPVAVDLEFSGNNLTPCMKGYETHTAEFYEKYRADTLSAIEIFKAGGAHVFLVGAPVTRAGESDPDWQMLNLQYEEIAAGDPRHVTYVDAGTAVELPGHAYTDTLPCLAGESCTGPVIDGVRSNVVRSPDGTHFCPTKEANDAGVIGRCTVYSSGAYRYAKAMVDALKAKSGRSYSAVLGRPTAVRGLPRVLSSTPPPVRRPPFRSPSAVASPPAPPVPCPASGRFPLLCLPLCDSTEWG